MNCLTILFGWYGNDIDDVARRLHKCLVRQSRGIPVVLWEFFAMWKPVIPLGIHGKGRTCNVGESVKVINSASPQGQDIFRAH